MKRKRQIKIFWVLVILMLGQFSVFAQMKEDARYKKLCKEYTLHADGSMEMTYSHELEYLSYYAIHRKYGETSFMYNPQQQEVLINHAYTRMKDCSRVETPENAFNEVLPYEALQAPAYNHLRKYVITHTALEIGAVSYLSYTIKSKSVYLPALMLEERVLKSAAVDELKIIVHVPKNTPVSFTNFHKAADPQKSDTGEFQTYTFIYKDLPAYTEEANAPHPGLSEPYLLFSTKSMKELYFGFIPQFNFTLNEKIESWVDELKEKADDENAFIYALQEQIAHNFATYPLSISQTGYTVRQAAEVFFSRGGTKAEKAALFVACLQYKGIKSYPVMVSDFPDLHEEVGVLDVFRDFIIRIDQGQSRLYLPVDYVPVQNLKYQLNKKSLVAVYQGISMFEQYREVAPVSRLELNGAIEIGKEAKLHVLSEAAFNPCLLIRKEKEAAIARIFTGIELIEDEDEVAEFYKLKSFNSEYSLHAKSAASAISNLGNDYFEYRLPVYKNATKVWHLNVMQPEREHAFVIPGTFKEMYDLKIKAPKGYKFSKSNYRKAISTDFGLLMLVVKTTARRAYIQKMFTVSGQTMFSAEDYPQLREMLIMWESDEFNTVIYKKK
jgi:hypothetical protein